MRSRTLMISAALAAMPFALPAQSSCAGGVTQDACQKAIDLFQYMAPQIGTVIAGGNATLGQGGTLGGFATLPFPHPKISVGFRVNALAGSLPNVDNLPISPIGAQSNTIPVEDQFIPGPAADVAIGVFQGLPLGITNVGGVDVLLSALYLPEFSGDGISLELPDGGFELGWGARVGLLQESLTVPGVSFTWLKRGLPRADLTGSVDAAASELLVNDLEVNTTSWRLVASKSLLTFGIAAGVGKDKYESKATVEATSGGTTSGPVTAEQSLSRTNYFVDLSMNLFVLKLIGEVGMVQGGEVTTFNEWDGKQPADSRWYGSVGARLVF